MLHHIFTSVPLSGYDQISDIRHKNKQTPNNAFILVNNINTQR